MAQNAATVVAPEWLTAAQAVGREARLLPSGVLSEVAEPALVAL